ncbi:MAG: histidinol-phosphatase [Mailhella sp.]|nr:histidinol-phosphatase [Mailhella sp.]
MLYSDLHIHTSYSHGKNTAPEMLEAALRSGIRIIGFSEHSPRPAGYDYPSGDYRERLEPNWERYVSEIISLKKAAAEGIYDGRIPKALRSSRCTAEGFSANGGQASERSARAGSLRSAEDVFPDLFEKRPVVLLGAELDWIPAERDFCRAFRHDAPYDYVIGGIHFLGRWGLDTDPAEWAGMSEQKAAYRREEYYDSMREMADARAADIAAHPDLVKIFDRDRFDRWLPKHENLVYDVLENIRDAGMAMEVSTAGLHKPCEDFYPGRVIMSMARALRLPISLASDAHAAGQTARDFPALEGYCRSFGYSESLVFSEGRPLSVPFLTDAGTSGQ